MRHRNETTSGALHKVSMAGGLEFFIDGAGFDDLPPINSVQFLPTQNADGAIPMAGPKLNSKCDTHSPKTPKSPFSYNFILSKLSLISFFMIIIIVDDEI